MVSEKSSIGEISSKISCSPALVGDVLAGRLAGRDVGLPGFVADQPVEAVGLEARGAWELREVR
jgi:hypothetical protein